jgi:hypothetical protein
MEDENERESPSRAFSIIRSKTSEGKGKCKMIAHCFPNFIRCKSAQVEAVEDIHLDQQQSGYILVGPSNAIFPDIHSIPRRKSSRLFR